MESGRSHVTHLPPGEGTSAGTGGGSVWLAGELYTAKAVGQDTNGAFALFEATTPPEGGPPPHIHHREDEAFYVLEGELEFTTSGAAVRAGAGSFVYVPKGELHTYKNVGTTPARYLGMVTPAGFEKMFEEVGTPATPGFSPPPVGQEEIERLLEAAPKYGLEIPPPGE